MQDFRATVSNSVPEVPFSEYGEVPNSADSIYRLQFSVVIHDEVHFSRKPDSMPYHALRMLSQRSVFRVGMTATPIITSLDDVWNIGRILKHPEFDGEENHVSLKKFLSIPGQNSMRVTSLAEKVGGFLVPSGKQ